jgi:hypothetical protein
LAARVQFLVWCASSFVPKLPRGIAETGIGGDTNYDDITLAEAKRILSSWGSSPQAAT